MTSIVSIVNSIYIFHISALFALNDVLQKTTDIFIYNYAVYMYQTSSLHMTLHLSQNSGNNT